MNRPPLASAREQGGFILVGVVMFMLALTILGLSLFALSSYEAQFFYTSHSREQSLQSSESGMEVVKALLAAPPYRLESAQLAVGQIGVTKALAYQSRSSNPNDTTSRGPINWDSTLVIVVAARAGGQERTLQARFLPAGANNPYYQLITAGSGISYNTLNSSNRTMSLTGGIWHPVRSPSDTAWTAFVSWPVGRPIDPSTPPTIAGNAFVNAKLPGNNNDGADLNDSNQDWIKFSNTSGSPKVYKSPKSPDSGKNRSEYGQYEFYCDVRLDLRIRGTVIWAIGQGACFRQLVTVSKDNNTSPGTLVIVAKPNGRDPGRENRGVWFQGGLAITDTTMLKVFVVSEGDIALGQIHNSGGSPDARALCVVAGGELELTGPTSGSLARLGRAVSMDAVADDLISRGALPATSGMSGARFAYARGSWLETRLP